MHDRLKHWRDVSASLSSGAANVWPTLMEQAAELSPLLVRELLPDGSWKIYAPPSTTIELKDSAGRLLMSHYLNEGALVIDGSPDPKPQD
jgi:hypothetical protein